LETPGVWRQWFSEVSREWTKLHQILGGHRTFIGRCRVCFRFQKCCFISELQRIGG